MEKPVQLDLFRDYHVGVDALELARRAGVDATPTVDGGVCVSGPFGRLKKFERLVDLHGIDRPYVLVPVHRVQAFGYD